MQIIPLSDVDVRAVPIRRGPTFGEVADGAIFEYWAGVHVNRPDGFFGSFSEWGTTPEEAIANLNLLIERYGVVIIA